MKPTILSAFLFLSLSCFGQVRTILDQLDHPIAFTFVNDDIYLALHKSPADSGQIVSFNINDPEASYQILFDGLTYPRAIKEQDSILYIGLRDAIVACDLRDEILAFDTLAQEQFLFPRAFAFDGNDLYVAHDKQLSRIDLTKPNAGMRSLRFFEDSPLALEWYNNDLLIAEGNSIHRYELGFVFEEIIADLEENVYTMLVFGNRLYIDQGPYAPEPEEILVYDLFDLGKEPELFFNDAVSVISLNEYNGELYFANLFRSNPDTPLLGRIQVLDKKPLDTLRLNNLGIEIFPNPTTGLVYIQKEMPLTVKLYNMQGMLMFGYSDADKLDMSGLPNGLYILNTSDRAGVIRNFMVRKID